MYPKDYILEKHNLIELWISHGYIESRVKRKTTEIGVEYYEELKQRSFLDDFSSGYKECCKLHDIIHDLARLNSENEHYSVEISGSRDIQEKNVMREAYHLYTRGFMGYENKNFQQMLKCVRTLCVDLSSVYIWNQYNELSNLTKLKALKILELKGNFSMIPDFIPELKHLTYLGITSFDLKTLPLSIGLLYNLQTLILYCGHLEFLPESIGDLACLQFLNIRSDLIKKLPKSLCSLSNLLRLVIKCCHLEEVPFDMVNLVNLHELTIISDRNLALPNTIGCLSSLGEVYFSLQGVSVKYLLDYVPHGLVSFPAIKKMKAWLRVRNIAWLKDMKALEGRLSIEGLEENNLLDAQCANLRNKCKIEALDLCWDHDPDSNLLSVRKSDLGLRLSLEDCEDVFDDVYFSLLECLQPHPNLKKLRVRYYHSATIPKWMRDPFYLQSIQEVRLEFCHYIEYVPFSNLHTLKHLTMVACHSIRVLQLEQLSSQLEELQISNCDDLDFISGPGGLDVLASLSIQYCQALKSLTMDRLHLVEFSEHLVEFSEHFGDSSHEKPHIGRQNISSLTRMEIKSCGLLRVLPEGLIPSGPSCYVRVQGCRCPDLEFGHLPQIKSGLEGFPSQILNRNEFTGFSFARDLLNSTLTTLIQDAKERRHHLGS